MYGTPHSFTLSNQLGKASYDPGLALLNTRKAAFDKSYSKSDLNLCKSVWFVISTVHIKHMIQNKNPYYRNNFSNKFFSSRADLFPYWSPINT